MSTNAPAPTFTFYTSNSLEPLVERLAGEIEAAPLDPLEREVIIVESRAMYRWLTLELARRLGIAATLATPFPGNFCRALCERVETGIAIRSERFDPTQTSPFDRDVLVWRIYRLLAGDDPVVRAAAAVYLGDLRANGDGAGMGTQAGGDTDVATGARSGAGIDTDAQKRYQLAVRLARCFDEYQLYRPDLLRRWERETRGDAALARAGTPDEGDGAGALGTPPQADASRNPAVWQAALWRALRAETEARPLSERLRRLIETLRAGRVAPDLLPSRVNVFGLSAVAPLFLDLLAALSTRVPVSFYLLTPAREFWGDILPERVADRARDRVREQGLDEAYAHAEIGNELLATLGRQGRELFSLVQELDAENRRDEELGFLVPERTTLLGALQADIVELVDRRPQAAFRAGTSADRNATAAGDGAGDGEGTAAVDTVRNEATAPAGGTDETTAVADRAGNDEATPLAGGTGDAAPGATTPAAPIPFDPADPSLRVHVCHSRLREMQVLRDTLLDAFAHDPNLRPHDVLVLVPKIEDYAPYIEAVFGVEHAGEPAIPYTIADRPARSEKPIVDAGLRLLGLIDGRFTATSVVELLDMEAVCRGAGIERVDVSLIRDWLARANVRWGIDADDRRERLGVAYDDADTWRAGLDRLLMGYAVGEAETLVASVRPVAIAAGEADLLGRFVAFTDRLFETLRALRRPRSLLHWARDLRSALARLLVAQGQAEQQALEELLAVVGRLESAAALGAVGEDVPLAVVRQHLRTEIESAGGGTGFLSGAVTFATLRALRSIPARIICLAGMNEGEFPRRDRPASFDLITSARRRGDRTPHDDDRYAFLEAVMAARDRLVITHLGRSQTDNSELAPASTLATLLDVVDRTFAPAGDRTARDHIVVKHPLQPFSERYFDGKAAALFSYSRTNLEAARAARDDRASKPLAPEPLTRTQEAPEVSLDELVEMWTNPSKYFCTHVLGLRLPADEDELEESEPFDPDALEKYELASWLLERRLRADRIDEDDEIALLRAAGRLAPGGIGAAVYERSKLRAIDCAARVRAVACGNPRAAEPRSFCVGGSAYMVSGVFQSLTPNGLVVYRPATIKPKDELRAWVRHVVLNAWADAGGEPPSRVSFVVGTDKIYELRPLTETGAMLDMLVEGFRAGCLRPLPFFVQASFAYVEALVGGSRNTETSHTEALRTAEGKLVPKPFHPGTSDGEDPYVRLCLRDRTVIDETEFAELARSIWEPYFEAREERKVPV